MKKTSSKVERTLEQRKPCPVNSICCATGGTVNNGCPFFMLNGSMKWICTLYRLTLERYGTRYKRLNSCINDEAPPVKREYRVCVEGWSRKVVAITREEAKILFLDNYPDETIIKIVDGDIITHEYLI